MNKVYKLVRSRTTGHTVVTSELAKGAKKGRLQKMVLGALFGFIASNALADQINSGYNPTDNDNKIGQINVSGTTTIDLSNGALGSAQKGSEADKNNISVSVDFGSLFQANANKEAAQKNYDAIYTKHQNGEVTDLELSQAQAALNSANAAIANYTNNGYQLITTGSLDPNGDHSEYLTISDTKSGYTDPVSGKWVSLDVKGDLSMTTINGVLSDINHNFEYYLPIGEDSEYRDMSMVNIAADADVTIKNGSNAADPNASIDTDNEVLNAISKNASGVISIKDGANLTYDANTNYYTGGGKSEAKEFNNNLTVNNTTTLYEVKWVGKVNPFTGEVINSVEKFNEYNNQLIEFIKKDLQTQLDYSTKDEMQAYYNSMISGFYTLTQKGQISAQREFTEDELEALDSNFANRIKPGDSDISVALTKDNYFIGVEGSGSTVTINGSITNSVADADGKNVSSGTVIKGDFTASSNNVFNINGKIDANGGDAIIANESIVNVAQNLGGNEGTINGNVTLKGGVDNTSNTVNNQGKITGVVSIVNGTVNNKNNNIGGNIAEIGSITGGNNVVVNNDGIVRGSVNLGANSQINNHNGSTILGNAVVSGSTSTIDNQENSTIGGIAIVQDGASFINNGTAGGAHAINGGQSINNSIIIGANVGKVTNNSQYTNSDTGSIYIGYTKNAPGKPAVGSGGMLSNIEYVSPGIDVNGNGGQAILNNEGDIYFAGNLKASTAIRLVNGGQYKDTSDATVTLNANNSDVSNHISDYLDSSYEALRGNDNRAFWVGAGGQATVNGTVELNDTGSTAFYIQNGGQVTLNGQLNLNSQNIKNSADPLLETSLRNFGAWVEGEDSQFTMNGTASIAMNADRAVGVHIRDGAKAQINDQAGIVFGANNSDQIGFLISAITGSGSLVYNSSQNISLEPSGKNTVLFRIERGSVFSSDTIESTNNALSHLDSNGAENSTLMVITNGLSAGSKIVATQADLSGFTLSVNGKDAKGVRVEGGAQATITDRTNISLNGSGATLAKIDGWFYDLDGNRDTRQESTSYVSTLNSSAKLIDTTINGTPPNVTVTDGIGYHVTHGGKLIHGVTNADGTIDAGTINFTNGYSNIGIKIENGGELINLKGANITVNGTAIDISGSGSKARVENVLPTDPLKPVVSVLDGTAAYRVYDGAALELTGSGTTQARGSAHGVFVDGFYENDDINNPYHPAASIVLNGAVLDLNGKASNDVGNGIENKAGISNIQLINNAQIDVNNGIGIHSGVGMQGANNKGTINVYGSGTGIKFEGIDKQTGVVTGSTENAIQNTGYQNVVINVFGADGTGIYVDSLQDVVTSASVNIFDEQGKAALQIKGETQNASQSGFLHSNSLASTIVDLNNGYIKSFSNSGDILFGSFNGTDFTRDSNDDSKNKYAITLGETSNGISFKNTSTGKINGVVQLLGYDQTTNKGNTVELATNSQGNVFITGKGDDEFTVNTVVGNDSTAPASQFSHIDGGEGYDKLTFGSGSNYQISDENTIKNVDYVSLQGNSYLTLNSVLLNGTDTYQIDLNSVLKYNDHTQMAFDKELLGQGLFVVNLTNRENEFSFTQSAINQPFKGTVELTNSTYQLLDNTTKNNTEMLAEATLKVSENSLVNVGENTQNIGGLTVNSGTLNFGDIDLKDGDALADHNINVDNTLTLTSKNNGGGGTIMVDLKDYHVDIPSGKTLLEQDDSETHITLVTAQNVNGAGYVTHLNLVDANGQAIDPDARVDLYQQNEAVARASYGVRLYTSEDGINNDGLYAGYGLTKVELKAQNNQAGEGNALVLDASNSSSASGSDFSALITNYDNEDGTFTYGDLQIRGNKTVSLSSANDYKGATYVKDTSTLLSRSDDALGTTRLLHLASNTKFDLNGYKQLVGSLMTNNESVVDFNNGKLVISGLDGTTGNQQLQSIISAETLYGNGQFVIGANSTRALSTHSPTVTILGDNTNLFADTTIYQGATVNLNAYAGLGHGTIDQNGVLNLSLSTNGALTNSNLSGTGQVNKFNTGTLNFNLAQAKDFQGVFNIESGAIKFNGDNNLSSDHYLASQINIAKGAALIGLDHAGFAGNIVNSGVFYVGNEPNVAPSGSNYKTVTVGNYEGRSGTLVFNGILTGDDSPINKLIVQGDASGHSFVKVNNMGGLGAQTEKGILLVQIEGENNAGFEKTGRIIAGAYDYAVMTGAQIDNEIATKTGSNATSSNEQYRKNSIYLWSNETFRPEVGGYITNLVAANNLFDLRLHDRLGETQYTDLFTGEKRTSSVWMRHQYNYGKLRAGENSLSMKNRMNVTQIGGDIAQWSSGDSNRFHLGVMAGYGDSKNKSSSTINGRTADSKVDGYSYGIYGTWYHNNEDKTGLYVDSWALWNDLNAKVEGKEFSEEYKLSGLTASIESGYTFGLGKWGNSDIFIQPKAQLRWGGVKAKDHTENNGTQVVSDHGNLQTRLGVRASLLKYPIMANSTANESNLQVFAEANWLHNSKLHQVSFDDIGVKQDGAQSIGELKLGLEGNIHKNTNLWLNIAAQKGSQHYSNLSATMGVKYSF
ncbi:autotransporter outer membrane beta-barrel domain-containing protein [Neisseria sp. Ec49-e6-T10]|uniref:autotransporter outer membrane beta-barrel domain-containing protein n=1 Tax=Neisseria sp. Ec49-e6-T10 TaxID=3140744 RepID=UPI003EB72F4A